MNRQMSLVGNQETNGNDVSMHVHFRLVGEDGC